MVKLLSAVVDEYRLFTMSWDCEERDLFFESVAGMHAGLPEDGQ